jgi:hypothetical protein
VRGRAAPERWNPPPPSPRAAEEAVEMVPTAGVEAPARTMCDLRTSGWSLPGVMSD